MESSGARNENPSGTYQIGPTIFKPLVVGAKIRKLMHCKYEWNVYLKPFGNENIGVFIREIVVEYENAQGENQGKVLQNMPYELTYVGHKSTQLYVTVVLRDEEQTPTRMRYSLSVDYAQLWRKNPRELVCERYGHIEVIQPSKQLCELLQKNQPMVDDSWKHFTNLNTEKRHVMQSLAACFNGLVMLSDPEMFNRFVYPYLDVENEGNN